MANREINKVTINKKHFLEVLESKGTSIRKLGNVESIDRNEKTIRRWLDEGSMPIDLLNSIASHLRVYPSHLSGWNEDNEMYYVLLSKEELDWLAAGRALKKRTLADVFELLEGEEDNGRTAFEEFMFYKDVDDEDEEE